MIRRIRDLLYDQGFTISGARNKMQEILQAERDRKRNGEVLLAGLDELEALDGEIDEAVTETDLIAPTHETAGDRLLLLRRELFEIRDLLSPAW
jgi:hypothetical protein